MDESVPTDEEVEAAKSALSAAADAIDAMQFEGVAGPAAVLMAGWLCAASDQVRLILSAYASGIGAAAAPNRRLLFELALRGAWLVEAGPEALTVFDHAQQRDLKALESVVGAEWLDAMLPSIREEFRADLDPSPKANNFAIKHFAQHSDLSGFYLGWWSETNGSHATRQLADRYAKIVLGQFLLRHYVEPEYLLVASANNVQILAAQSHLILGREGNHTAARDAHSLHHQMAEIMGAEDYLDGGASLGLVPCPQCRTPMDDANTASNGSDAHLVCPACGFVVLSS